MASIKERVNSTSVRYDGEQYRYLFAAILADLATLAADVATIAAAMDTLAAKLNADAGVTDVDYSEATAAAMTTDASSMSLEA